MVVVVARRRYGGSTAMRDVWVRGFWGGTRVRGRGSGRHGVNSGGRGTRSCLTGGGQRWQWLGGGRFTVVGQRRGEEELGRVKKVEVEPRS